MPPIDGRDISVPDLDSGPLCSLGSGDSHPWMSRYRVIAKPPEFRGAEMTEERLGTEREERRLRIGVLRRNRTDEIHTSMQHLETSIRNSEANLMASQALRDELRVGHHTVLAPRQLQDDAVG